MNIKSCFLLLAVFLITCFSLEARDGRGGGVGAGGGRGAGSRPGGNRSAGGNTYSRTPSMSRANPSQVRSQVRQATPAMKNQVLSNQQGQPRLQQGQPRLQQQTLNRSEFLNQARQHLNENAPTRVSQSQVNRTQQNIRNAYPAIRTSDRQAANKVKDTIRSNRSNYREFFGNNFNNRFNYNPNWYTPGYNAWTASNWNNINGWLGWGWSEPLYYDNVGSYMEVPAEYIEKPVSQLTNTGNWLTLGVFAASKNEKDAAFTNLFVQMVMDKSGLLSGTYYNAATDQIHPLDGFVDKDTQQAVWRVSDKADSPVMTTGIFNLTQDVADVKVRYSNGVEQYWKLVRLQ